MGMNIVIKVNCRADAGDISEPIRYGLAVTLEHAEGIRIPLVSLPIYQEVRDRLASSGPSPSAGCKFWMTAAIKPCPAYKPPSMERLGNGPVP